MKSSEKKQKMKKNSDSKSDDTNKRKDTNNEVVESSEKQVTPMKECNFCGKKFSSGKALGGHKRFHIQYQMTKKERELDKKADYTNCDGNNNNRRSSNSKMFPLNSCNERLTCYICDKDFPSEKSLFGHMRSHPDRDWRGVQPPNASIDDDDSSDNDSVEWNGSFDGKDVTTAAMPVVDVSKSLPQGWQKTDTRGRESVETLAVMALVSMVNKEEYDLRNLKEPLEESNNKKRKLMERFKMANDDYSQDEENWETLDGYKCNICKESFLTFQGLRRHRSSHNKEKNKSSVNDEEQIRRRPLINGESDEGGDNIKVDLNFDLNEVPNNGIDEEKN